MIDEIIKQIAQIEENTFSDSWDEKSIRDTLSMDYNHLVVLIFDEEDANNILENDIHRATKADAEKLFVENSKHKNINVVGYILYSVVAEESELYRIAVRDEYKKSGCGIKLMKKYIEKINDNTEKGFLEVRAGNIAAISLYEKFGYKQIAVRKNYYSNPKEDAYIYELLLP